MTSKTSDNRNPNLESEYWPVPKDLSTVLSLEKEFPLSYLPGSVRNAIKEYQSYGQQPIPLIVSSALANLSLSCQGLADVARNKDLKGPISLNVITIAESGERKTTVDKFFATPIKEWQKDQSEKLSHEIAKNNSQHKVWNSKVEAITKKLEEEPNAKESKTLNEKLTKLSLEKPNEIFRPNFFVESATKAALVQRLNNGWPSLSIWSDEAGTIIGSHGMNKERILEYLSVLNKLHDGGTFMESTISRGEHIVAERRVTCNLMMQEIVFNHLLNNTGGVSRAGGFLARGLICYPMSTAGKRFYKEPPDSFPGMIEFSSRIKELLDCQLTNLKTGTMKREVLSLSREAKSQWVQYFNEIEAASCGGKEYEFIKDFASKSAEMAARLAGCFHTFDNWPLKEIQKEHMEMGIECARWYLHETLRILNGLTIPAEKQDAVKLLSWLQERANKWTTLAQVQNGGPYSIRPKNKCLTAAKYLEKHKYIRIRKENKSTVLQLNPHLIN